MTSNATPTLAEVDQQLEQQRLALASARDEHVRRSIMAAIDQLLDARLELTRQPQPQSI